MEVQVMAELDASWGAPWPASTATEEKWSSKTTGHLTPRLHVGQGGDVHHTLSSTHQQQPSPTCSTSIEMECGSLHNGHCTMCLPPTRRLFAHSCRMQFVCICSHKWWRRRPHQHTIWPPNQVVYLVLVLAAWHCKGEVTHRFRTHAAFAPHPAKRGSAQLYLLLQADYCSTKWSAVIQMATLGCFQLGW